MPLITGQVDTVRDWALTGIWGREVHVLDGRHTYARAPRPDNRPLSMWSNRWSTMPIHALPTFRLPRPDRRAELAFMPGSDVPVIRQPFAAGDTPPFWATPIGVSERRDEHLLYDLADDPAEHVNLAGTARERDLAELLRHALDQVEAPDDQYQRLGLS